MSANGNGMAQRLAWLGILVPALCVSPMAMAEWELNLREGVTDISRTVFDIHMTLFWICVVIGAGVFSVMLYSIINHRKSKGAVAAQFHESTLVEILWTVIPTMILVVMAVPATLAFIKSKAVDPALIPTMLPGVPVAAASASSSSADPAPAVAVAAAAAAPAHKKSKYDFQPEHFERNKVGDRSIRDYMGPH